MFRLLIIICVIAFLGSLLTGNIWPAFLFFTLSAIFSGIDKAKMNRNVHIC
jgi:cytochrome b561